MQPRPNWVPQRVRGWRTRIRQQHRKEDRSVMNRTPVVPPRIAWAVDHLAVQKADRILEIGGGRGAAAALICPLLRGGCYVGIDRSATAVRASAERNQEYVARGVAKFERQAFEELDPAGLPVFDTVFAINVNLFWTRPAQRELALVRRLLGDQGRLHLFYDGPTSAATSRSADLLAEHLDTAGYTVNSVTDTLGRSTVIGLSCQPH